MYSRRFFQLLATTFSGFGFQSAAAAMQRHAQEFHPVRYNKANGPVLCLKNLKGGTRVEVTTTGANPKLLHSVTSSTGSSSLYLQFEPELWEQSIKFRTSQKSSALSELRDLFDPQSNFDGAVYVQLDQAMVTLIQESVPYSDFKAALA